MTTLMGVAGGSGAGKSALVRELRDRLREVCVIDLDAYYVDRSDLPPDERRHINYDEPAAIDRMLLLEHLRRLSRGHPVNKPRYSFATHARTGTQPVRPAPLVVVDGLFALWWEELRALLDLKVYVEAPADLRLARRIQRDMTERGRDATSVLAQYLTTVRPMHAQYVEPTRAFADLVVENDGCLDDCVARVAAALQARNGRGPRVPGEARR